MNLLVRADADRKIGTGHIMRCLAFAQTWKDYSGKITFLSHCENESLRKRIIDEGFDFVAIESPHPDRADLSFTLGILEKIKNQNLQAWLILDGYHFTPEYQKTIRDEGYRLLVIDDINHLTNYHADIVLNQNIYAPDLKYRSDKDTILLLGNHYVVLRREFLKYQHFKRRVPEQVKNILVTLGGSDLHNVTLKVIQALKLIGDRRIEVKIVVGPVNHNIEKLQEELTNSPFTVHLLSDVDNMPELMIWADLAISAGGSTCWELAYMGLPSLLIILAENQVELVKRLGTKQAAVNIGWYNMFSQEQLFAKIDMLINNMSLRRSISENALTLVDGQGISRIIDVMVGDQLMLRQATYNDCNLIWQWSNEEKARQASFSQGLIPWNEHVQWFKRKLADPNHIFFIATKGNKKQLGQIRYSIEGYKAIVSLSIDAKYRSLGYGSEVLRIAARKLFHETSVEEIMAFVKDENSISLKTFMNAGFKETEEFIIHRTKSHKLILKKKK